MDKIEIPCDGIENAQSWWCDMDVIGPSPKTVNDLIEELSRLSGEMRQKPVMVCCPNGLEVEAAVKFSRVDKYAVLNASAENTEAVFITWR